ncbi:MAG: dehydrogenase, partial [Candidatus Kariarchaeaceae archaeon]
MTDRARALWFLKPYSSVIKDIELPALDSSSLKIQTLYSSISPGTERLVFQGLVPIASQDYMAVPYMEGDFSFPIKYGYSLVGEVIEGNDDYSGKLVHVMHPHQDKIVVNEKDIRLIPDTISAKRATLISYLETCI